MKNLLIIVDPQNDFITGSLAVPGAVEAMDNLVDVLNTKSVEFSSIIVTIDFHPFDHCSFKENGGEWPSHCIQYTEGAAIYQPLAYTLRKLKDTKKVFLELM
jgi:nicotinamidase/pyrazinamidase